MALLTDADIESVLSRLPGWERAGSSIRRTFDFDSFAAAIAFVDRVAELADEADHHPDIDIRYSKVTLVLSTHSAGGLTHRDARLAERIDSIPM